MILVVDDHRDTAAVLVRLLRSAGHTAMFVPGGVEALTLLNNAKPALLILDVNMPEMDGLTVLQTIKQRDELKDVKVLMYSANAQRETMREASRLGASDYVVKGSVPFDSLLARISKLAGNPSETIC